MERQNYYRQFVRNQIETYFDEKIDLTKAAESILPEVQIDLYFEIPKEKLVYAKESPFPNLAEANPYVSRLMASDSTRKNVEKGSDYEKISEANEIFG